MLIREEKKDAKMYRKLGYPGIAKQESGHAKKLSMELKRRDNAKKINKTKKNKIR